MDGNSCGWQRHAGRWRWSRDRFGVAWHLRDKLDEEDKSCEQEKNEPQQPEAEKTQA